MKRAWLVGLVVFCLAAAAQAQSEPGAGDRGQPSTRPHRGLREGRSRLPLIQMMAGLPDRLELNDAQRKSYDEIAAKYKAQWEESQDQGGQMRELAGQYRQARQDGDTERADQIRRQMEELGNGRAQVMPEFFKEVEAILDEQQIEKLDEFRQELRQQAGGPDLGLRQLIRRLPEELNLTEEQKAKFDELVAEQRQSAEQRREASRELRPLIEEIRQARRAGDEKRAAELQAELEAKRAGMGPQSLLDKLEPILTDEQKAKLAELKKSLSAPDGPGDVRRLLETASRLDLSEEQRAKLKEIRRWAMAAGGKSQTDAEAGTELAQAVKKQITEMLDANQANEFERLLADGPRHGERRGHDEGQGGGRDKGAGKQKHEQKAPKADRGAGLSREGAGRR